LSPKADCRVVATGLVESKSRIPKRSVTGTGSVINKRCETNGGITVARVGNERGLADRRVTVSAYVAKKRQIADRGILTAASVGGERRNTKSGIVTIANLRALCVAHRD